MFKVGNNFGKFSKRGKATDNEIKKKIKELANGVIDDIDIKELSVTQRINLLKACLPYLISKELSTLSDVAEDVPLFLDNQKPKIIIFNNREELDEYNEMSEEEQDALGTKADSFFNSKRDV